MPGNALLIRVIRLALLFAAYAVTARIGLSFASVHPSATAIWPPTGIALAAFLVLGRDVWPAIFAGAFVANLATEGSIVTSIGIGLGNTLEAALGASLVERFANGGHAFDRPRDIFRFVALAGVLSTTVSPTIGVVVLSLAGYAAWSAFGPIWFTWWLGDIAGALLVAPLLLTWNTNPLLRWDRRRGLEALLLIMVLAASAVVVFTGVYPPTRTYPLAFVCIPPLVWTAFRFGPRETAAASLIVLGIATWGTLEGFGPFVNAPPAVRLLILQAFMVTVSTMAMSIAALVAEQKRILARVEQARLEAEAASSAKDTFLAMLGHELRNPLAAIMTAAHVLDRIVPLEGKAVRIREIIGTQVSHLTRLVDDLLDVTRVTSGKIILHRTRLDLTALVSQSLDALAAAGRTGEVSIELSGPPTWVDVDPTRMKQVVTNLVTNALKYTPSGGTIRVSVGAKKQVSTLTVEDTGIGIRSDLLPRIFDLFAQGDQGTDRSTGGLGVGLTIVKRLVELHGGSIEAISAGPGRGSTFTVDLPAAEPRSSTDRSHPGSARSARRRVLIVEDQGDLLEVLSLALTSAGHTVFEAPDGPHAIEAMTRSSPDVALIDIGLPGYDGYEVARRIRAMPGGDTMYLIALTGYGQPDDRRRAEEAGFDLHIVKPVDPERLNALVADSPARANVTG